MTEAPSAPEPQITVLDAGGQYCHLISRKIRDLGVYSEVRPSDVPAAELESRRGVILSGGPASVYEEGSPRIDPALFSLRIPVLGICYGQQLMAHLLGGRVRKGDRGEFGLAQLHLDAPDPLFAGSPAVQQVWMSHRDHVSALPAGFHRLAHTGACEVAAMGAPALRLYGVQFHPEVVHTLYGDRILANFVFDICGCARDWSTEGRSASIEASLRTTAAGRKVFFFVSGGVDSTVAFTLCLRALGPERVRGVYVDTGLMREGETDFVRELFHPYAGSFTVIEAQDRFLSALEGVCDPEQKRRIIGEEFLRTQQEALDTYHVLEENWILGQGTIYPDTIESGGTEKAALIKTHHNRVAGIQRLLESNRVLEPLRLLYKDEVRTVGRELGLPAELLDRHPFPGPGLAVRCLCSPEAAPVLPTPEGWLLPVRSVGVQGDSRSYAQVLCLDSYPCPDERQQTLATDLINRLPGVNRVVALVDSRLPLQALSVSACALDRERLHRLRRADAIVRRLSRDSGFDRSVWQFPVILIPLGGPGFPDSVVLRPVDSVDGMTAQSVAMPSDLLREMAGQILAVPGVCAVLYDLTHKPPATIEWE